MFKRLLDYNSPENVWLRKNRKEAIGYGLLINTVVFVAIGVMITNSYKKDVK